MVHIKKRKIMGKKAKRTNWTMMELSHYLSSSKYAAEARNFATVFGTEDHLRERGTRNHPYSRHVEKKVMDCLAGKRPDLQIRIWEMVIRAADYLTSSPPKDSRAAQEEIRQVHIDKLAQEIIEYTGHDLGTVILIMLIGMICDTGGSTSNVIQFSNEKHEFSMTVEYNRNIGFINVPSMILSKDVKWEASYFMIPDMPEMMKQQLKDKKVSDIISHPVFDRFNMNIMNHFEFDDDEDEKPMLGIRTDWEFNKKESTNVGEIARQEIMRLCNKCSDKTNCCVENCRILNHFNG